MKSRARSSSTTTVLGRIPSVVEPPEAEPEEKPRGWTLAVKFAASICAAVVVILLIFGILVYRRGVALIDEQIDRRGIEMVQTLAQQGRKFWEGEEKNREGSYLRTLFQEEQVREEFINLFILKPEGAGMVPVASGRPVEEEVRLGQALAPPRRRGEVTIAELPYISGGRSIRVRQFTAPVRGGEQEGWSARVILRADRIDEVRNRLLLYIFLALGLAIALGAGISYYLSSLVTRPIRALVTDMRIVSRGDLDHQTVPQSQDEVGLLATNFNRMTQALRAAHKAELEKQAIERDLHLARGIQAALLPKRAPKAQGVDVAPFYRSAKEVGGDYYDFVPIDAEHLGVAVADVSGKGVQGSMVMTMTRSSLRSAAVGSMSPAQVLKRLNRIVAPDLKPGSFVTVAYGVLDVKERTFRLASAGHNPSVVVSRGGKQAKLYNPKGIAVGLDRGPIFDKNIGEEEIRLEPGDRLVLYTDGVVEAMNEAKEEFGSERFYAYCVEHAAEPSDEFVKNLVEELDRYKGKAPQHDDITIVSLRFT